MGAVADIRVDVRRILWYIEGGEDDEWEEEEEEEEDPSRRRLSGLWPRTSATSRSSG